MPLYGLTIFLSSFLLFLVQPLIGKYILPWFGGTPGVWTTCLLFFQLMLLGGYGYAHWLATTFRGRRQVMVHGGLLLASLICLPVIPESSWKEASAAQPTPAILALLTATVGLPYLLLSASAPLMQQWFSVAHPDRSPYRLYAVSNIASLGALLAYPALFERFLRLDWQCYGWSAGYFCYVLAAVGCGIVVAKRQPTVEPEDAAACSAPEPGYVATEPSRTEPAPTPLDQCLWILLSACGTLLLMATTNQITQDVAPIPFLWVVPLSLYLITFIICFEHPQWYQANLFTWLFVGGLVASAALETLLGRESIPIQLGRYAFCLFAGCMCCHGELVHRRPAVRWLTKYYLLISLGGALGGCFVALGAPRLFADYREYWLGLALTCLLVLIGRRYELIASGCRTWSRLRIGTFAVSVGVLLLITMSWLEPSKLLHADALMLSQSRNFYGTLRVANVDMESTPRARREMSHGSTRHGFQYLADERRHEPTAYYSHDSGIGVALQTIQQVHAQRSLRVGVVGLGVGTVAAYANTGDRYTFYEINPLVIRLSEEHFSFQRDARSRGAVVDVRLGDGRLVLEQELNRQGGNDFHVLAIDAFSSDSVPVHLLTRECFEIYWRHLADDAILAVHVSNLYLDLQPVILAHAQQSRAHCFQVHQPLEQLTQGDSVTMSSNWLLLTQSDRIREALASTGVAKPAAWTGSVLPKWTDDFSSLLEIVR